MDEIDIVLHFEVLGLARDGEGHDAPAGVKLNFGQCTKPPASESEWSELHMNAVKAVAKMLETDESNVRPIDESEYREKGYHEVEGEK